MLALQEKKVREIEEVGRQLQPLQEEYRRQVSSKDSRRGSTPAAMARYELNKLSGPAQTNRQEPLNNDISEVNQIVR